MAGEKVKKHHTVPASLLTLVFQLLFRLEQPHGLGDVYLAWQSGSGLYLATTGVDCMVNVFDRYGSVVERIRLPK